MAEQDAAAGGAKTRRTRGPNYPALNLADAVERINEVWNAVGPKRVGDEDVARALGYNKLHGKSRMVVSALKKYGLLQPDGDGHKVSEEALDIINLDSDDPDRARAMRDAALRPALFAELHEKYPEGPPGESILRNYLTKRNFSPKVADEVMRLYRDTMDLVSQKIEKYTPKGELGDGPGEERREADMEQQKRGGGGSGGAGALAFDVPGPIQRQQHYGLADDRDVYLLFVGKQPTKEDIATLKDYLDIFEKRLPSEASLEGANEPTAAPDGEVPNGNGHQTQ